jgi:hypothetical protein
MVGGWFDAASLHRQKDPSRPFAFKRAVGRAMLLPALLVPYIALCNRGHGVSGALFAGWQVATWSVVPVLPVAPGRRLVAHAAPRGLSAVARTLDTAMCPPRAGGKTEDRRYEILHDVRCVGDVRRGGGGRP